MRERKLLKIVRSGMVLERSFFLRRTLATVAQVQNSDLQSARPYNDIPGPKPIPIFGNKFRFLPGFRKYFLFLQVKFF